MHGAVVWFKRDLRIADHAPLAEAAHCDAALGLFIIEPAWLTSPECHPRHVDWLLKCLAPLRDALAARGLPLLVRTGEAVAVLSALRQEFAFSHLLSHEETGPGWSYVRDRQVAQWCRSQSVAWTEFPQTGVVRRLKDRKGWASRWQHSMDAPCVPTPQAFRAAPGFSPAEVALNLPASGCARHLSERPCAWLSKEPLEPTDCANRLQPIDGAFCLRHAVDAHGAPGHRNRHSP